MPPETAHSGEMDVNGAQLWYEMKGIGDPIVPIHAGITDSRMWDPQLEALARDHLVVRYDMRGYGRSTIPPEPFAHHDDLYGLFQELSLGPAVIIGASYGGNVAASFAVEHPELTRALVLVNTLAGMRAPSEGLRAGWRAVNAAMDEGDVAGAAEDRELEPPVVDRLGEIAAPALVIVGELDQPDAIDSADALVAGIPNARRASIPDSAHLPSMERPEAFNRIVREFLATFQA